MREGFYCWMKEREREEGGGLLLVYTSEIDTNERYNINFACGGKVQALQEMK